MDAKTYEEWDKLEDTHWWFIGRKRIFATIIDNFLVKQHCRYICDIGSGAGAMIPILSARGKVWGIESSIVPLEKCRKRGFKNVILAKSENLPFKDASLDLLALFDVIEHTDDDHKVLSECNRVCKQNATIIVSVPAYQFLMSPNDIVAHHKRRYRRKTLVAKLKRSGFRATKTTYYNFFLFPLIFVIIMFRKTIWRVSMADSAVTPKGNISYKVPEMINSLLLLVLTVESRIIRKLSFPFGHSLVSVAIKE